MLLTTALHNVDDYVYHYIIILKSPTDLYGFIQMTRQTLLLILNIVILLVQ